MIKKDRRTWGVVLTAAPFSPESKFKDMKIEAEIARPSGGRGAVTARFAFSRMPIAEKFTPTEMMAWVEAGRAIIQACHVELEKLRQVVAEIDGGRRHRPKKAIAVKSHRAKRG